MFLVQHLLSSSSISLNAANLSVHHRSCLVLASSKDIIAFMKKRRLKLILAENVGWQTSRRKSHLSFRKSWNLVQARPLHMRYQKKSRNSFFFITSLRYAHLLLLRTSSGSCSINAISLLLVLFNHCNHFICKNVSPYSSGFLFVARSRLRSRVQRH